MDKIEYLKYAFRIVITLLVLLLVNCASADTIIVPDDYEKIQWAINNAITGDTIEVHSGIYHENVIVNTTLDLIGIDTGAGKPEVDSISCLEWAININNFYINSGVYLGMPGCNIQYSIIKGGIIAQYEHITIADNIIYGGVEIEANDIGLFSNTFYGDVSIINEGADFSNDISYNIINGNIYLTSSKAYVTNNKISGILDSKNYEGYFSGNEMENAVDDGRHNFWDNNHFRSYDEPREGCKDLDKNGICDNPYNIPGDGGSIDYNPISKGEPDSVPEFPNVILPISGITIMMLMLYRKRRIR